MRFYAELLVGLMMMLNGCSTVESDSGGGGTRTDETKKVLRVSTPAAQVYGIEVVTLSRGRGVPAKTLEAYAQIKELVSEEARSGAAITQNERIIGLEGERRFCISLPDQETSSRLLERMRALSVNVELLHVIENGCGAK